MKRLALIFAALLALAGTGCDKDKPETASQPAPDRAEEPKKPETTALLQQAPLDSPAAERIMSAASPSSDPTGITSGRMLFDGDRDRGALPEGATGVWAGSGAGQRGPKFAYTAPARSESLSTKEPPSPLAGRSADELRDALNDPKGSVKKPSSKPPLMAKDSSADAQAGTTTLSPSALGCPAGMALIQGFCIDRYEGALVEVASQGEKPWPHNLVPAGGRTYKAVSAAGRKPQAYISADQAAAACSAAGKRLCTIKEWVKACQGPLNTQYPYGGTYQAGVCNEHSHDAKHVSPMFRLFGQKPSWDTAQMNDPRLDTLDGTVAPSGSFSGCTNGYGVYDMVGNVHEWTSDRAGSRGAFKGGYFNEAEINGPGCRYTTTAHGPSYRDYSTGFRCCAEPKNG